MSLRCFVEGLGSLDADAQGRLITLSEPEARHARLSRRLSAGDAVVLFDGRGTEAPGVVGEASKNAVQVAVGKPKVRPRPRPELTIAVAMPKGPRQDVLIEKCTELGVAGIQPLLTERSVAGVSDHKRDKWRRATIEAAKQSHQCWLPELMAPLPLAGFLNESVKRFDLALAAMLSHDGEPAGMAEVIPRLQISRSVLALVGPEGGWTPEESAAILAAGAKPVSLGPHVLRIETAAIALAAIVHACASTIEHSDS